MELPVLHAQCDQCFGLCCVVLPFSRQDGFAVDKPGGTPCANLDGEDRCSIHERLSDSGWPGCVRFDCFGAGQRVSRETYGGVSWRESDNLAEMGAVLSTMRQLHELIALLDQARDRGSADAEPLLGRVLDLSQGDPETLLTADIDDLRGDVGAVLAEVAAATAQRWPGALDLSRADRMGKDLRHLDLRGANLRGALLIRADLRGVDLTDACLLGADLRDADLRGAHVADALFLTGPQVAGARTS